MSREKLEPVLFGWVLSGLMSLVVSGISTARVAGLEAHFIGLWAGAWMAAWLVAFPLVLVAAPVARKLAHRMICFRGPTR